jgi:hypothetical protein
VDLVDPFHQLKIVRLLQSSIWLIRPQELASEVRSDESCQSVHRRIVMNLGKTRTSPRGVDALYMEGTGSFSVDKVSGHCEFGFVTEVFLLRSGNTFVNDRMRLFA